MTPDRTRLLSDVSEQEQNPGGEGRAGRDAPSPTPDAARHVNLDIPLVSLLLFADSRPGTVGEPSPSPPPALSLPAGPMSPAQARLGQSHFRAWDHPTAFTEQDPPGGPT